MRFKVKDLRQVHSRNSYLLTHNRCQQVLCTQPLHNNLGVTHYRCSPKYIIDRNNVAIYNRTVGRVPTPNARLGGATSG